MNTPIQFNQQRKKDKKIKQEIVGLLLAPHTL
jgi:hypothetical protein